MNKKELIEELGKISWTAEKQSRLIESLERLVDQLQYDHQVQRGSAERDQKSMLNEQDQFVAELIEDHAAALAKVTAERDEARQRVEQLEQLAPQSRVESQPAGGSPPPESSSNTPSEPPLDLDLASLLEPDSEPPPAQPPAPSQPPPSPEPTTPEPEQATPSGHRSPLAIALASTHPSSRPKQPSGQFDFPSSVRSKTPPQPFAAPRTPSQPPAKAEGEEEP